VYAYLNREKRDKMMVFEVYLVAETSSRPRALKPCSKWNQELARPKITLKIALTPQNPAQFQTDYGLSLEMHAKALAFLQSMVGENHPDTASTFS
jgi:hypothetical protein